MMTDDSIGIDISKDFLDAHRLSDGSAARFPYTSAGFRALETWLGEDIPPVSCMKRLGHTTRVLNEHFRENFLW